MSAVGAFFGRLFGTDEALNKVMDTGRELLDDAFYTDQEEAQDRAAARSEARAMVVEWTSSTTGSRLARRGLAFDRAGALARRAMLAARRPRHGDCDRDSRHPDRAPSW